MNASSSCLRGIRAAIVDLDGTMLHTAPDFHLAINRMRAELSLAPMSLVQVTRFVGKGSAHLVRQSLAADLSLERIEPLMDLALASFHRHYFAVNGDHASIYPGVRDGLNAMRDYGLRLACVTNKPHAFAAVLLEKTGLDPFFELLYGGDSLPKKKPDPYPLLQVCRDFDLEPRQVVAIGDSCNDTQAARAAGCPSLIVPYGYNHGQPVQGAGADGIVPTLLDAAHLLFRLT